jgi:hypothetical protein
MPVAESNIYALWAAKQTAKGTPATVGTKRFQQVAGDISTAREDGSENFSDLDRFGDAVDYINTLQGSGAPVIQAQPNATAYLLWLYFGGEAFTALSAGVSPPKFVFTPQANTGFWATFWKRIGLSEIQRQKFNDCKISSIKIEGSTANKVVKVTPTIISLDPGETFATDPTPTLEAAKPLLYTDAVGTFTIDGSVFNAQTQFAVTLDAGLAAYQGDAVKFQDLVAGAASISMEGPTILLDTAGIAQYNQIIYGTATPTTGTKPRTDRPVVGSFACEFKRGTLAAKESIKVELPGVKWSPDLAAPPNPDGGAIELALNGEMRKVSGQPAIRITVETGGVGGDTAAHTA